MKRWCMFIAVSALAVATLVGIGARSEVAHAAQLQKFCVSGLSDNVTFEWKADDLLGINIADKTVTPFVSSDQEFIDTDKFAEAFVASINSPPPTDLHASQSGAVFDPCFMVARSGGEFHFFVRTPAGAWCNVSTVGPGGCAFNPTITMVTISSVGGVSEQPDLTALPVTARQPSGTDYLLYGAAAAAASLVGVAMTLGVAARYVQRKRDR